jgi:heme oxygenase
MNTLQQATAQKHKEAEQKPFNQKMIDGSITNTEYLHYLSSQYHIFKSIEDTFELPHPSLSRVSPIKNDIDELGEIQPIDTATQKYTQYIESLNQVDVYPHIYLNYLALMFGGQILKQNTPTSGCMYTFDNMSECISSIRRIQKDEWVDEVNKGFSFIIEILDTLNGE